MTDEEIKEEIYNIRLDLDAFVSAKAAIQRRILDLEDDPIRHARLVGWAGTQAVLNTLILCEVRCRGLIDDLQDNITKDADVLFLVEEKQ